MGVYDYKQSSSEAQCRLGNHPEGSAGAFRGQGEETEERGAISPHGGERPGAAQEDEGDQLLASMKKEAHPPGHKPGDVILNRYMIGATEEEREAARENLREYAAVVLRIATRLATEEWEAEKRGEI